eukprot:233285-Hanusia_phi.AAC.1
MAGLAAESPSRTRVPVPVPGPFRRPGAAPAGPGFGGSICLAKQHLLPLTFLNLLLRRIVFSYSLL